MNKLQIKPCKKCGSKEHTIKYIWDDTMETIEYFEKVVVEENDYLRVKCSTCEYSWREEVLERKKR